MRTFIDSNVFLYADDAHSDEKQGVAQEAIGALIESREAVISTQVLQEYFATATRKFRLPHDVVRRQVVRMSKLDVVLIDPEMILAAIDLHLLRKISPWDALIVRAAIAGGCARLLTEDLNHGETFDGVRVENPFR